METTTFKLSLSVRKIDWRMPFTSVSMSRVILFVFGQ